MKEFATAKLDDNPSTNDPAAADDAAAAIGDDDERKEDADNIDITTCGSSIRIPDFGGEQYCSGRRKARLRSSFAEATDTLQQYCSRRYAAPTRAQRRVQ